MIKAVLTRSRHHRSHSNQRAGGASTWLAAAALLPLLVLVGGLIEARRARGAERSACARAQALVGGHGLGAVTVAAWCTFTFDPRSEPLCSCPTWPVPGSACFCPDHAASVASFQEQVSVARVPRAVLRRRDGTSP
jgi:hypothetical protein